MTSLKSYFSTEKRRHSGQSYFDLLVEILSKNYLIMLPMTPTMLKRLTASPAIMYTIVNWLNSSVSVLKYKLFYALNFISYTLCTKNKKRAHTKIYCIIKCFLNYVLCVCQNICQGVMKCPRTMYPWTVLLDFDIKYQASLTDVSVPWPQPEGWIITAQLLAETLVHKRPNP